MIVNNFETFIERAKNAKKHQKKMTMIADNFETFMKRVEIAKKHHRKMTKSIKLIENLELINVRSFNIYVIA